MLGNITRTSTLLIMALAMALSSAAMATPRHRARAQLYGPATVRGWSKYEDRVRSGQTDQRFRVKVRNGIPGQELGVFVNGSIVGTIMVNGGGTGKLDLRTAQFINGNNQGEIPAGFPVLDTGDIVTVGPVVGVFFDQRDHDVQRFRLEGKIEGPGGFELKAHYRERFRNGRLVRKFEVEIENGTPNESQDILVNGEIVGTITTDNLGNAEFELKSNASNDDDDENEHPMPSSFPSLQPGDTVQVGSDTVTLNFDDDDNGGGGGGDDSGGDDNGGDNSGPG